MFRRIFSLSVAFAVGVTAAVVAAPVSAQSGENLPASLVYVRGNQLYRLDPGDTTPRLIKWVDKNEAWASPSAPVFQSGSADTFYFSAYAFRRFPPNVGAINIDVAKIYYANNAGKVFPYLDRKDLSVSPDFRSTNVTYVSNQHARLRSLMPKLNTMEIFLQKAPLVPAERITHDGGVKYFPQVSPDGQKVSYLWLKEAVTGIYVVDVKEKKPRLVVKSGNYPTWRPDGRALTYVYRGKLYEVDLDETLTKPVGPAREIHPFGHPGFISFPRWTEHGLIFQWARKGEQGISLYDPETKQTRVLMSGPEQFGGADLASN